MCSPKAGAGRVGSPGVRLIFTGRPSCRTVPSPGCSIALTIPRARTSSESSASSTSSTGSMQQSCSSLNAFHSARVRPRKTSATVAQASEPGASNWTSIRSGRSTPLQKAAQNFGSRAPQVTQPSAAS